MSVKPTTERTYTVTLGGKRLVRQAAGGHREWSLVSQAASPRDLAPLEMFASGDWGVGPWWWLSPWAVGTNALTPDGSLLKYANLFAGAAVSGPVQVEGGLWIPVSAITSGSGDANAIARSATSNTIPCPPGVSVTGGIFASPGQQVRLTFFNSSNISVGSSTSPVAGSDPMLLRVTTSRVSPAATAMVRVDVIGAGRVAGASVSFTAQPVPWAVGDGCEQAVVDSESRDIDVITSDPWANQSYTIKEVG